MSITKILTSNVDVAMDVAGHNFEVEKTPLSYNGGIVPDHVAVVNKETGKYLGTVGIGYEPVQPKVIYTLAQELMDSTVGTINGVINMMNGAVIGISFSLAEREYVAGDPTELNFLMLTSFNGTYALCGSATTNRISCLNQVNASSRIYSLKHTRFVGNRIGVVKNIMKYYNHEIKSFDKKMEKLVNTRMDTGEALDWFRSLFPVPKSPLSERKLEKTVITFLECLQNGRGSNIPGVRGTSYGAFQALTEYINHHRTIRVHEGRDEDEVRFRSIHFGSSNTLAQKGINSLTVNDMEFSEEDFMIE